jgi:hypothetical protein
MVIANTESLQILDRIQAEARFGASLLRLDSAAALAMVPILRSEAAAGALLDPSGAISTLPRCCKLTCEWLGTAARV